MGFCRNVAGLRQCVEGLLEKRLDLDRVGQGKAVQYRSRFITDLEHDFVQFAVFLRKAVVAPFMCEAACAWNKRQRSPGQPDDVSIDRKRVVAGKSVSVRVDHGGRLSIKKKKK